MALSATEKRKRGVRAERRSLRGLAPLILVSALALSGCGDKPPQPAAAAAPPVTVAQPVKRTVTDWDEFTGRFEAVEEVQIRARVGGFVTSVEFRDGAIVHATATAPARQEWQPDELSEGIVRVLADDYQAERRDGVVELVVHKNVEVPAVEQPST